MIGKMMAKILSCLVVIVVLNDYKVLFNLSRGKVEEGGEKIIKSDKNEEDGYFEGNGVFSRSGNRGKKLWYSAERF